MSFRAIIDKHNSEVYAFPKGWSTRKEVAAELGCGEDRVKEVLRPAIAAGLIEEKIFKIWVNGTMTRASGFRELPKASKKKRRHARA